MENRKQLVEINNTLSDRKGISCGVPQGSILGALYFWFMSMIWNRQLTANFFSMQMTLLLSFPTLVLRLLNQIKYTLQKVRQWLHDNKLSLHLGKTERILFGSRNKLKKEILLDHTV